MGNEENYSSAGENIRCTLVGDTMVGKTTEIRDVDSREVNNAFPDGQFEIDCRKDN